MKVIRKIDDMRAWSRGAIRRGQSVGLVPTMGAPHEGHAALIRHARRENKRVVVSIFVNPTQFGPKEDLSRYPRPFARDQKICRAAGADVLFFPSVQEMYPDGFQTWIHVTELSRPLCGPHRPGHFRGMATVVAKLLLAASPTRAYFGEKDFQQLQLIRRMVRDLNIPVEIVPCPTVREVTGLALSSRNAYLSPIEARWAPQVALALRRAAELAETQKSISAQALRAEALKILRPIPGGRLQYLELVDPDTLFPIKVLRGKGRMALAFYLGKTRLIDNIEISTRKN